jgi:hypothetical protein
MFEKSGMRVQVQLAKVRVTELIDLGRLPAALSEISAQRVHIDRRHILKRMELIARRVDDLELKVVLNPLTHVIAKDLVHLVRSFLEHDDLRLSLVEVVRRAILRRTDDDLIARLTEARGRSVQDAAARALLPMNDICPKPRAVGLIPDVDKLKRVDTCESTVGRIEGDRTVIIDVSAGDVQAM